MVTTKDNIDVLVTQKSTYVAQETRPLIRSKTESTTNTDERRRYTIQQRKVTLHGVISFILNAFDTTGLLVETITVPLAHILEYITPYDLNRFENQKYESEYQEEVERLANKKPRGRPPKPKDGTIKKQIIKTAQISSHNSYAAFKLANGDQTRKRGRPKGWRKYPASISMVNVVIPSFDGPKPRSSPTPDASDLDTSDHETPVEKQARTGMYPMMATGGLHYRTSESRSVSSADLQLQNENMIRPDGPNHSNLRDESEELLFSSEIQPIEYSHSRAISSNHLGKPSEYDRGDSIQTSKAMTQRFRQSTSQPRSGICLDISQSDSLRTPERNRTGERDQDHDGAYMYESPARRAPTQITPISKPLGDDSTIRKKQSLTPYIPGRTPCLTGLGRTGGHNGSSEYHKSHSRSARYDSPTPLGIDNDEAESVLSISSEQQHDYDTIEAYFRSKDHLTNALSPSDIAEEGMPPTEGPSLQVEPQSRHTYQPLISAADHSTSDSEESVCSPPQYPER